MVATLMVTRAVLCDVFGRARVEGDRMAALAGRTCNRQGKHLTVITISLKMRHNLPSNGVSTQHSSKRSCFLHQKVIDCSVQRHVKRQSRSSEGPSQDTGPLANQVEQASVTLHELRLNAASEVILDVESYVNLLANSPKEFDTSVAEFRLEVNRFQGTVIRLETQAAKATSLGAGAGAAGLSAGVGVAALGPSAAMAVATTFGIASTGTAISALSGAAATNAALAWLGGGAIAAGGGGMAGGTALLALAGPVGLGLAGAALVGSGVFLNSRNRKHARQATEDLTKVEAEVRSLDAARNEIDRLHRATERHTHGCNTMLSWLSTAPADYQDFNDTHKKRLAALINHIRSLSGLLQAKVSP